MKLRAAAWAGTQGLTILAASCSRSTPANTTSSQGQPITDQAPPTSSAPAAHEAVTPEKSNVTQVLKKHRLKPEARADMAQRVPPALPPAPVIVPVITCLQFPLAQPLRLQMAGNNPQQLAPNQEGK